MSQTSNKLIPVVVGALLTAVGIVPLYMAHADGKPAIASAKKGVSAKVSNTPESKGAYAIGYQIGAGANQEVTNLDASAFQAGFQDGQSGKTPAYSMEELQASMMALQEASQKQKLAQLEGTAQKNTEEGTAFLQQNKTKAGVKTTTSGLQYEVLKEGTGKSPTANDTVKVHYEGKLISGAVFDTSYGKEAISFGVGQVIAGWTEGLQLMKEGGKYRLYIPSELAYGTQGAGNDIPPNSTLIFEVELLKVNP